MLTQPPLSSFWRWINIGARLLLVWFVLRDLAPAPPRVTPGSPQTVETLHPEVCVHTRLTDEVEEWKIQRNMIMVRELGAPMIVEFFPWPYVEGQRGTYDWAHFDRIMRHAENQGISVIARLGLVPGWARPPVHEKVTTANYLPYEEFDTFAAFVGAFVRRYEKQISAVIIWNEPNISREWGDRPVDPEAYTELLRVSYLAAHEASPNIIVMGGALAPTMEPENSGAGMNEIRYLERMYEAGAADYFDAFSAHTYGFTHPPDDDPDPTIINFRRIELQREIMIRYGDEAKPVYITESGWSDDPRWANAVRPGQRIAYTL
ncbi:MAG: beta-galactosidase, partial [Chloroflexi bacterium]|nr:beta-galactosidase [Chloroflexota bacterium]